jgi:hypothetical protein
MSISVSIRVAMTIQFDVTLEKVYSFDHMK